MKRREILKILFGSLTSFVIPVKAPAEQIFNTTTFINLCNLAISHEYGAIIQYINHAGLINQKKIKNVLLSNMRDEIYHARRITEILIKEGATPTVAMWPPQTGKNLKQLLEEDISGEEAAIRLYQQILDLKESSKYRDDFQFFLNREITHRSRLVELSNAISR
ncbi:bacterioferritin [Desulfurobacterium pacificum]|uniref:Bacterioferritin n=1 Tax=Desulfurobacterium pacificum TaxID=240166 RepID=A0ABY1NR13_9BACT|nr:ferritin-like domain-containing protein [Desulfurobacterium pacificum]SMP15788.1 bacterioferritin [Desulfurobacterium pacificum]